MATGSGQFHFAAITVICPLAKLHAGHNYYKILFSHNNYLLAACKCQAPTENNSSESASVMISTQFPVYLVWKFACQLYHGTQPSELFSTNVTQLSAYHNLSDLKKVNPGQKISQKCIRICSCS